MIKLPENYAASKDLLETSQKPTNLYKSSSKYLNLWKFRQLHAPSPCHMRKTISSKSNPIVPFT